GSCAVPYPRSTFFEYFRDTLRPDDRAVPPPRGPPGIIEIWRTGREGEFRREFFLNLDAEARLLLRQHVAVLHFRAAHKYLLRLLGEAAAFVHTEVVTRQLKCELRGVRHRRRIARSVPGRAYAEKFAQGRNLARSPGTKQAGRAQSRSPFGRF